MAELFDIVVRRQIYIEGLKAAKEREFAGVLSKLRTQLAHRLQGFEFEDLGNATKTALRRLIVDLRAIAKTIFDPYLKALIDWLQRFVAVDRTLLLGLYAEAAPEARKRLKEADDSEALWAFALKAPMAATGTLALPFLMALLPMAYVKFERLTMQHYANQAKRSELIEAIIGVPTSKTPSGFLRQLNAASTAATNTVIQHLGNQINQSLGEKIVGFYEWVSVLDDLTSKICRSRDGNRYPYGRGPIPPAHPNCRSSIVPVNLNDPSTPDNYKDWLGEQPDEFVRDALDGRRTARYEQASPIDLAAYSGKSAIIGL